MAQELFNQTLVTTIGDTEHIAFGLPGQVGCKNILWSAYKTFSETAYALNNFQFASVKTPKLVVPADSTTALALYKANGTSKVLEVDTTNQYLYIKQVGADATSTASQKSSGVLYFETSNWTGSTEAKHKFSLLSLASTSTNESNLLYIQYDNLNKFVFANSGQFSCTSLNCNRGSNAAELDCILIKNGQNTLNNSTRIINYNTDLKATFAIKFINTSHDATTGTSDLSFLGCPSGGSLVELVRLTSAGYIGIGVAAPKNLIHVESSAESGYLQFTNTSTGNADQDQGTKFGIDLYGNALIKQQENLPLYFYTNNVLRAEFEADGDFNLYEVTAARKGVIWNATNQYLYIKQVGADATSTASQKSSGVLYFETSNWTGAAQEKKSYTLKSSASTSSNSTNNFLINYDTTNLITLEQDGGFSLAYLAGTGQRLVEANTTGKLSASEPIIIGKLASATTKALLSDSGNWTGVDYTGTAITGTYEGQYYDDGTYYYYAYSDNDWRRLERV